MNGINHLFVDDISPSQSAGGMADKTPRLYKISLQMTDGALIKLDLERTFATRNLP
jgi:hypothetical protein